MMDTPHDVVTEVIKHDQRAIQTDSSENNKRQTEEDDTHRWSATRVVIYDATHAYSKHKIRLRRWRPLSDCILPSNKILKEL